MTKSPSTLQELLDKFDRFSGEVWLGSTPGVQSPDKYILKNFIVKTYTQGQLDGRREMLEGLCQVFDMRAAEALIQHDPDKTGDYMFCASQLKTLKSSLAEPDPTAVKEKE